MCIWVIAITIVAMLPMRLQWFPGLALLIAAPALLAWIAADHGWWVLTLGAFAFMSMLRRPLGYLMHRFVSSRPEEESA